MSKPPLFPQATVSGIIDDPQSQQRVIPESRRADGSIRKERKVKPGFTPAEDVTRFRSARQLDADRRRPPPGSVPGYIKPSPQLEAAKLGLSKSAKKNAKRKEGRAAAHVDGEEGQDEVPDAWDDDDVSSSRATTTTATPLAIAEGTTTTTAAATQGGSAGTGEVSVQPPPSQDPAKRALNLGKKIKAAESLRDRKEKGEKLLPEQQVKVDALEDMRRELEALGL